MWKIITFVLLLGVFLSDAAYFRNRRAGSSDCPKECVTKPMEISFVVDSSASIWPENFTLGLNFIEDFVNQFDISPSAVRVSLVTYGDKVYKDDAFGFDAYSNNKDLMEAIADIPHRAGSMTNTGAGIWYMLNKQMPQARPGVRRVAIVMTDGNSQETEITKKAASDARESGLEVFAIGLGINVSAQELHNIASDDRHVFVVDAYHMLEGIKKRLAYEACDQQPSPPCEMDPVDLSFVIDSSASIGEANFTVGMHFVKDFVNAFEVNPTAVRISAVTYGEGIYTMDAFNFDTFKEKKSVMDRLEGIQWRHGQSTDTWAGIEYMRRVQMVKARPNAAHICFVITDGKSQETKKTAQQARLAQEAGIVMYAIGVGKVGEQLDGQELLNIAGDQERVVTAENYAHLNLVKDKLTNITCSGILQALQTKAEAYRT